VATNADSLGTWFVAAVAAFARDSDYLLDIASTTRTTPPTGCAAAASSPR
jgi:hypothetical protein